MDFHSLLLAEKPTMTPVKVRFVYPLLDDGQHALQSRDKLPPPQAAPADRFSSMGWKANDQKSAPIVALMDELFVIDRESREQNLDHAQRNALRQERAPQLLEQLRGAALAGVPAKIEAKCEERKFL
ncbi:MAG: hypothetical protein IRZ03_14780 [Acidobacterium ailaaui]|nr:hypothetical protein [Pseudacidobacterium ailaaui]